MENLHFDFEALRDKLEYDDPFIKQFLEMLKEELEISFTKLIEQSKTNNWEGIKNAAHRIKGSALNACFNKLGKISASLEKMEDPTPEKIMSLIKQIEIEIALAKETIEEKVK